MSVLINFKICDNAKECNGIAVCPTGALAWDEKKGSIKIDNTKCVSCGKCEKACSVDAIMVAKNQKQYEKLKKEIENDPRSGDDLLIDRYGAQPVHPIFLMIESDFDLQVLQSKKIVAVEFFNEDSIACLLRSIPLKELIEDAVVKYRKLEIKDNSFAEKYKINQFPSMLFFKDGEIIGRINGYYDKDKKVELKKMIDRIVTPKK
jgi:NAD-dependent dihydropyrimidine dehydrogenase PreA subunit